MAQKFLELTFTPAVQAAQAREFGRSVRLPEGSPPDTLTADETDFIQSRDSFYLSTVSETGWPYVQHRGGAPGFLRVLSPSQLGFADYTGNRQLLSTGNLSVDDRVCLFLMDYPQRTRLKILGHARVLDVREHPDLLETLAESTVRPIVERLFLVDVVSFDWNCPKYITPPTPPPRSSVPSPRCAPASSNSKPSSRKIPEIRHPRSRYPSESHRGLHGDPGQGRHSTRNCPPAEPPFVIKKNLLSPS